MHFAHCPQCGNMEFRAVAAGKECLKWHFAGKMPEGPMDAINAIRKRARTSSNTAHVQSKSAAEMAAENSASAKELAARLKSLKGKTTDDVEFL